MRLTASEAASTSSSPMTSSSSCPAAARSTPATSSQMRLAIGGAALIFDNDAESPFGRRMALRKFMTRYFGLRLVPDYYCNASYPPLNRLRQRIAGEGQFGSRDRLCETMASSGLWSWRAGNSSQWEPGPLTMSETGKGNRHSFCLGRSDLGQRCCG